MEPVQAPLGSASRFRFCLFFKIALGNAFGVLRSSGPQFRCLHFSSEEEEWLL